jgi:hypothetical protein
MVRPWIVAFLPFKVWGKLIIEVYVVLLLRSIILHCGPLRLTKCCIVASGAEKKFCAAAHSV